MIFVLSRIESKNIKTIAYMYTYCIKLAHFHIVIEFISQRMVEIEENQFEVLIVHMF